VNEIKAKKEEMNKKRLSELKLKQEE